jgi:mannan endo-1,4-beta-mannosidase
VPIVSGSLIKLIATSQKGEVGRTDFFKKLIAPPLFLNCPSTVQPPPPGTGGPSYNKSTGFYVLDGRLYDHAGKIFVPRGVNNTHGWDRTAINAIPAIKATGMNAARLVWAMNFWNNAADESHIWQAIDTYYQSGIVPMMSLWEGTGSSDEVVFWKMVDWWIARAAKIKPYERTFMLNIANEYGRSSQGGAKFRDLYSSAIQKIRNAGINTTIVVDSFEWTHDWRMVRDYGQAILDADPQKNVVFSTHLYCGPGESETELAELFKSMSDRKLAYLVGEFAHTHEMTWAGGGFCDVKEQTIMRLAQQYGNGYYSWAWVNSYFSITNNMTSSTNLTAWGNTYMFDSNGVKATSTLVSPY